MDSLLKKEKRKKVSALTIIFTKKNFILCRFSSVLRVSHNLSISSFICFLSTLLSFPLPSLALSRSLSLFRSYILPLLLTHFLSPLSFLYFPISLTNTLLNPLFPFNSTSLPLSLYLFFHLPSYLFFWHTFYLPSLFFLSPSLSQTHSFSLPLFPFNFTSLPLSLFSPLSLSLYCSFSSLFSILLFLPSSHLYMLRTPQY